MTSQTLPLSHDLRPAAIGHVAPYLLRSGRGQRGLPGDAAIIGKTLDPRRAAAVLSTPISPASTPPAASCWKAHAAAAYDWTLHYAAENAIVAHSQAAYLGWHYPPPFLMIAGLLATLPYTIAFLVWIGATLPLYLTTIRAIVGNRIGWLIGGAFPCLMPNIISGQNGFFTASLVGGALVLAGIVSPLLAGCCLGLLTYKPQFGILFPLRAGRRRLLAGDGERQRSAPPRWRLRRLFCSAQRRGPSFFTGCR